jgi:hypothetical protein
VHEYQEARRRLLVFGYNATLTTGVEQVPRQPKRQFDNLTVRCAAHAAVRMWPGHSTARSTPRTLRPRATLTTTCACEEASHMCSPGQNQGNAQQCAHRWDTLLWKSPRCCQGPSGVPALFCTCAWA